MSNSPPDIATLTDETELAKTLTDEGAFTSALIGLLRAAHVNDIELQRSLACRNGPEFPDWEVDIVRVQS